MMVVQGEKKHFRNIVSEKFYLSLLIPIIFWLSGTGSLENVNFRRYMNLIRTYGIFRPPPVPRGIYFQKKIALTEKS